MKILRAEKGAGYKTLVLEKAEPEKKPRSFAKKYFWRREFVPTPTC
jgi:hypothetical protein